MHPRPHDVRFPLSALLTASLLVLFVPAGAGAQRSADTFSWEGRLPTGQTLEIRNVQGSIRAVAAAGDRIEVEARKRGQHDDPSDVEIEVVPHANGITICAVYPTPSRTSRANECGPERAYSMSTDNHDVQVDFTVRVPAGVRLAPTTFSGDIDVQGVRSHVDATTMSGNVRIVTSEAARARTMSGRVSATIGSLAGQDSLEFSSMSGSVELLLPANAGARLRMSTMSGGLHSDFPITVEGRVSPQRMEGTIGGGGPLIELRTMSGSVRLRRGG